MIIRKDMEVSESVSGPSCLPAEESLNLFQKINRFIVTLPILHVIIANEVLDPEYPIRTWADFNLACRDAELSFAGLYVLGIFVFAASPFILLYRCAKKADWSAPFYFLVKSTENIRMYLSGKILKLGRLLFGPGPL